MAGTLTWRAWARRWLFAAQVVLATAALCTAPAAAQSEPARVRIAVMTLFHPRTLVVEVAGRETVTLHAPTSFAQPDGSFWLTVPGKLRRRYQGALRVETQHGELLATVAMDPEVAVASMVAAELPAGAPFEALKAQAVVSRSFLLANAHAHAEFDACDTTHCQFLRSPPEENSPAARAVRATRHQVLAWTPPGREEPRLVRAMYSRSCGGRTHAHASGNVEDYPFYAVACAFCLRHPERWTRAGGTAQVRTEEERIRWNRVHGWSGLPSTTGRERDGEVQGRGMGHGVGLCQLGAEDMAARSEKYSSILRHFFPNTAILTLP